MRIRELTLLIGGGIQDNAIVVELGLLSISSRHVILPLAPDDNGE